MPAPPVFRDRRIMVVQVHERVERRGTGWIAFAATMLVAAAWVNVVWGVLALGHDAFWSGDALLYGNVPLWGWLFILAAPVQLAAALLLYTDNAFGAVLGVFIAVCSGVLHIATIGAHPVGSATVLVIDALVIFGLLAHGFWRR
jgi:hypothetical protein